MGWTAIVPLKAAGGRKSRLAERLSAAERDALSEAMLAQVATVLMAHRAVSRLLLLSAVAPAGWAADWRRDAGRGLNAELADAAGAIGDADLLIVHADLPLVGTADLDALFACGRVALAPDARGRGTNALAVRAGEVAVPLFGEGSLARFRARYPQAAIVRRDGLALDVDTPDDLARAEAGGFRWR